MIHQTLAYIAHWFRAGRYANTLRLLSTSIIRTMMGASPSATQYTNILTPQTPVGTPAHHLGRVRPLFPAGAGVDEKLEAFIALLTDYAQSWITARQATADLLLQELGEIADKAADLQEQARQTNSVPNTTFHPGASTGTATVTAAAVIVDPDLADAADATPAQTAQAIEELRLKQRVLRAQARLMALKVVAWGIATVIGGLWETITIVGALLTVMPPTSPLSVPQAWGIGLACVPTLAWCGEQGILPLFDPKRASRLTLGQRLAVMVVVILSVAIACVRGELVLGHNFSDYAVFVISSVAVPGIALAAKRFINGAFWNAGEYQRFKDLLLQCQLMLATLQAQAYGQHRVQQATEQQQALTQSQQAQAKREQEQNQQRREQQLRQMNLEIQRKHRQLEALVRSVVNELLRDPDIKKTLKAVCWDIAEPQQTALTASSSSNGNFLHDPASSMPGAVNPSGASAWPSGRGNARQNNPLMLGMPGNKNGTSNHP